MGSLEPQTENWNNLIICMVEDADTLLVRESSNAFSESKQLFYLFEKYLNETFNKQFENRTSTNTYIPNVGEDVMAHHNSGWFRGVVVEKPIIVKDPKSQSATTFFVDYGESFQLKASDLFPIKPGSYKSVPMQVKRIKLAHLTPLSLDFSFGLNIILKKQESNIWDTAARRFVEKLKNLSTSSEFRCFHQLRNGSYFGELFLELKPSVCQLIQSSWEVGEPNFDIDKMSLADILVGCGFAIYNRSKQALAGMLGKDSHIIKENTLAVVHPLQGDETSSSSSNSSFDTSNSTLRNSISDIPDSMNSLPSDQSSTHPTQESLNGYCGELSYQKALVNISVLEEYHPSSDPVVNISSRRENLRSHLIGGKANESSSLIRCPSPAHPPLGFDGDFLSTDSSRTLYDDAALSEFFGTMTSPKPMVEDYVSKLTKKRMERGREGSLSRLDGSCPPIADRTDRDSVNQTNPMTERDSALHSHDVYTQVKNFHPYQPAEEEASCISVSRSKLDVGDAGTCSGVNVPRKRVRRGLLAMNGCHEDGRAIERADEALNDPLMGPGNTLSSNAPLPYSRETKSISSKTSTPPQRLELEQERAGSIVSPEEGKSLREEVDSSENFSLSFVKLDGIHASGADADASTEDECDATPFGTLSLPRINRVYNGGEVPLCEEQLILDERDMNMFIEESLCRKLRQNKLFITRLQNYTWPAMVRGRSCFAIGGRSCGKTVGYMVPLLSLMLAHSATWRRRSGRTMEPSAIILCFGWTSVLEATELLDRLLPPGCLHAIAVWGAFDQGQEEALRIELLKGCDILITTLPSLLKLIANEHNSEHIVCVSLKNCSHLVIDDAEQVFNTFPDQALRLVQEWNSSNNRNATEGIARQFIVTAAFWFERIQELIQMSEYLYPNIIISSHIEAAVAVKVPTILYYVKPDQSPYNLVLDLIQNLPQNKAVIFTHNEKDLMLLKQLLFGIAVFSETLSPSDLMWEIRKKLSEWQHSAHVLIVCDYPFNPVLQHDLRKAKTLIQFGLPPSKQQFGSRYSAMLDHYPTDFTCPMKNGTCHLVLTEEDILENVFILEEMARLGVKVPPEVALLEARGRARRRDQMSAVKMCHYVKAYGKCSLLNCEFRHHVTPGDVSSSLPSSGQVTLDVIEVIDASRYFARITSHSSPDAELDLTKFYKVVFTKLQEIYRVPESQIPLKVVEKGMLCAVNNAAYWARAEVIKVDYSKQSVSVSLFLIDEGSSLTRDLEELFTLPDPLVEMPPLITEVYLCDIEPVDRDISWTPNATSYMRDLLTCNKESTWYVGKVALSLGRTLWLSPIVGRKKNLNTVLHQRSLKSALLALGLGASNPGHMESLLRLCLEAKKDLSPQSDLDSPLGWMAKYEESLSALGVSAPRQGLVSQDSTPIESPADGNVLVQSESSRNDSPENESHRNEAPQNESPKNESHISESPQIDSPQSGSAPTSYHGNKSLEVDPLRDLSPLQDSGSDAAAPSPRQPSKSRSREKLELGEEVEVEVGEIISPLRFYVMKQDNLQRLECLEEGIQDLALSAPLPPIKGDLCLAQFMDRRFYRGEVMDVETNLVIVFFVDHGETLAVPRDKVYPCDPSTAEELPFQAILCQLDKISVPQEHEVAATALMNTIVDSAAILNVVPNDTKETSEGLAYLVDLLDASVFPTTPVREKLLKSGTVAIEEDREPRYWDEWSSGEEEEEREKGHLEAISSAEEVSTDSPDDASSTSLKQETRKEEKGTFNNRASSPRYSQGSNPRTRKDGGEEALPHFKENGHERTSHSPEKQLEGTHFLAPKGCSSPVSLTRGAPNRCSSPVSLDERATRMCSTPASLDERPARMCSSPVSLMSGVSNVCSSPVSSIRGASNLRSSPASSVRGAPNARSPPLDEGAPKVCSSSPKSESRSRGQLESFARPRVPALEDTPPCFKVLHPKTLWKQDSQKVHLKLEISDVETYECRFNSQSLRFMTYKNDVCYIFDEILFGSIDPDHCYIKVFGMGVTLSLSKQNDDAWPRLLQSPEKVPWLKYDLLNLDASSISTDSRSLCSMARRSSSAPQEPGGIPAGFEDDDETLRTSSSSSSEDDLFKFG